MQTHYLASFSAGEICIANASPVASRLEWTGFQVDREDDPIKNDKFHTVDEVPWPAHHVNFGQFFSVSGQGLLLKEQSFGIIFQQKLEPLSGKEMEQWFLQYFNRLTMISGTGAAYKDGRQAFMKQRAAAQFAAAPLAAAPLPAEIVSPSITIASMPAAASSQAMQQGQHFSLPAAPPLVPPPCAMPCSSTIACLPPAPPPAPPPRGGSSSSSAGAVMVEASAGAFIPASSSAGGFWGDVLAARAAMKNQFQQHQQ